MKYIIVINLFIMGIFFSCKAKTETIPTVRRELAKKDALPLRIEQVLFSMNDKIYIATYVWYNNDIIKSWADDTGTATKDTIDARKKEAGELITKLENLIAQ
jgi:hypothetical protein